MFSDISFVDVDFESDIKSDNYSFFAFNILKSCAKDVLKNDPALFCLTKSDTFLKDLLNTFNGLYQYDIKPKNFFEVLENSQFTNVDRQRLLLCVKLFDLYLKIMDENSYEIPLYKDISLDKNANEKNFGQKLLKVQDYECIEFSDVEDECLYITEEIKNIVQNSNGMINYSDFAIFADKSQMRQRILDMIKAANLPVITSIYDEQYENLKYKISLYHKICNIFERLGIEEFNPQGIKNPKNRSKADKEILFSQVDEYMRTLVMQTIEDISVFDGIFISETKKSLTENMFGYISRLNETDKEKLNKEFALLTKFYEFYIQKNYAKAIGILIKNAMTIFVKQEIKDAAAKKLVSLDALQQLYDNILKTAPDFDAFKQIIEWLGIDRTFEKNAITLEPIKILNKHARNYKYVYVAGLTQNNFPGTNSAYPFISYNANKVLNFEFKKINSDYGEFLKTDEYYNAVRMTCLFDILGRSELKITFTTHSYEAKKIVQPSFVFTKLAELNKSKFKKIELQNYSNLGQEKAFLIENVQNNEKIIADTDKLKLNASAIRTFQNCPRKYYYKNLLNLKEPYTFSASYGSIVHAVFELMNRKFLNAYNKTTAVELAEILFNSATEPQNAIKAGFKETDIELVTDADRLSLEEMKDNLIDAIDDFSMSGGFDNPPVSADCEKSFTFVLEELPQVIFDGRIDAILKDKEGNVSIVDYKTGKNKTNSLDYAFSEYGVNFKSRTGKEPANIETLQNAYDYQIPLYYFASQKSLELKEYKGMVSNLGFVYIRPKSKDNGCDEDFISADKIEFFKDKIIQNLKETVVDKIMNETEFKQNKTFACENCAYKFLCDGDDNDE